MIVLTISPDKIKDVIGPGGKVINKIIAETGAKIDIENDGHVFISAPDGVSAEKAKSDGRIAHEIRPSRRDLPRYRHATDELRCVRRDSCRAKKASCTSRSSRRNASSASKMS